jgi:hypothetical protein
MKLGNLYNFDSYKVFQDSARRPGFTDAYAGTVLARQLTAIDPTIFEKKYPELSFVSSGIDADNSGGFVQRIQSLRKREQGSFKRAGDNSGNKGKISLAGEESSILVVENTAESDWSETDIKQAELQNINLPSDYITAHNSTYLREVDEIGYLGIGDTLGLLNTTLFTSGAGTGAIGAITAQQMYDDMADLITSQWAAVNNTPEYMANRVDMPIYALNTLMVTILNTAAGSASVLNALKANFPGVEFRGTFRADNAGGAGVSHTVAYSNNSQAMKMRIPVPLTIGEITKPTSFKYHVESMYRIAGLDILESTAGQILTGW